MVISVGDIDLGGQVVLAPMSGVTDLAFRRSVAACGAAMVVSEMVASEELVRGRRDVLLRAEGRGLSPLLCNWPDAKRNGWHAALNWQPKPAPILSTEIWGVPHDR